MCPWLHRWHQDQPPLALLDRATVGQWGIPHPPNSGINDAADHLGPGLAWTNLGLRRDGRWISTAQPQGGSVEHMKHCPKFSTKAPDIRRLDKGADVSREMSGHEGVAPVNRAILLKNTPPVLIGQESFSSILLGAKMPRQLQDVEMDRVH